MHLTGPERWPRRQRWFIATRKSASIFAAFAAIATATWMGGRKKKHGQRWSSVDVLKKLSVLTFARRIVLLRFSRNGMHTAMCPLSSERESPGTGSSTKGSIYSKHLHGTVAFGFTVQRKICKSKCFGHCLVGVNSLLILMPSGRSMASTA